MIRLVLLAIGFIIILAILWDGLRRKKKQTQQIMGRHAKGLDKQAIAQRAIDTDEDFKQFIESVQQAEVNAKARVQAIEKEISASHHDQVIELPEEEPAISEAAMEHAAVDSEYAPMVEEIIEETEAELHENASQEVAQNDAPAKSFNSVPDVVIFTIRASEEKAFGGFSLLQVLLARGFRFADDKLFYYHEKKEPAGRKLFGLAAATENGSFDLSNMARFTCKGLILFLHPKKMTEAADVLHQMIEVAEELAEDLDSQLYIGNDLPWREETLEQLRELLER